VVSSLLQKGRFMGLHQIVSYTSSSSPRNGGAKAEPQREEDIGGRLVGCWPPVRSSASTWRGVFAAKPESRVFDAVKKLGSAHPGRVTATSRPVMKALPIDLASAAA